MILTAIITIIAAYFIGSVNFAVLFTRAFTKKDVRDFGSGNAGSTNALRVGGKKNGILTFVCDFLKGSIAGFMGKIIFSYIMNTTGEAWAMPIYGAYICAIFCLLGHIFPLFFGFKGGKGVATGAGVFLSICPLATLIGLVVFTICFIITKTVSVSSLIATVMVVATAIIMYDKTALFVPQMIFALILLLMVVVRHKDNILRLIRGEENVFSLGGNK